MVAKVCELLWGNPDNITIMGQIAGAGVIGILTVLSGGKGILPFQQVQSEACGWHYYSKSRESHQQV